jgi:hypothetical protein
MFINNPILPKYRDFVNKSTVLLIIYIGKIISVSLALRVKVDRVNLDFYRTYAKIAKKLNLTYPFGSRRHTAKAPTRSVSLAFAQRVADKPLVEKRRTPRIRRVCVSPILIFGKSQDYEN